MSEVITHVGIDAHKKDLFLAMLIGRETRGTAPLTGGPVSAATWGVCAVDATRLPYPTSRS